MRLRTGSSGRPRRSRRRWAHRPRGPPCTSSSCLGRCLSSLPLVGVPPGGFRAKKSEWDCGRSFSVRQPDCRRGARRRGRIFLRCCISGAMAPEMQQRAFWALVRRQHGVVAQAQLLAVGLTVDAIRHRVERGRLYRVYRGVYVVGRPELTELGSFMAAVLSCGEGAALSHTSGAALWRMLPARPGPIHVSTTCSRRGRRGIVLHRRQALEVTRHRGIPVTTPAATLIDIAGCCKRTVLEAAINEADKLDLIHPAALRRELEAAARQPGLAVLRALLDRHTYAMTDSVLERLFVPIARRSGLGTLRTQQHVNGHRVDFYCPELGLVVEADGGRHHRTPMQQTRDRRRDQAHTAAGLIALRFTHAQIAFEPAHVEA